LNEGATSTKGQLAAVAARLEQSVQH